MSYYESLVSCVEPVCQSLQPVVLPAILSSTASTITAYYLGKSVAQLNLDSTLVYAPVCALATARAFSDLSSNLHGTAELCQACYDYTLSNRCVSRMGSDVEWFRSAVCSAVADTPLSGGFSSIMLGSVARVGSSLYAGAFINNAFTNKSLQTAAKVMGYFLGACAVGSAVLLVSDYVQSGNTAFNICMNTLK